MLQVAMEVFRLWSRAKAGSPTTLVGWPFCGSAGAGVGDIGAADGDRAEDVFGRLVGAAGNQGLGGSSMIIVEGTPSLLQSSASNW